MDTVNIKCIICNRENNKILGKRDYFRIIKCNDCGLIFTYPIPDETKILKGYSSGKIIKSSLLEKSNEYGEIIFPQWKIKENYQIFKEIHKYKKTGRMLDAGCLWGLFLSIAQNYGWDCYGVEPYKKAATYAREKHGLNVFQGNTRKAGYPDNYFDVITTFDVLEHVVNPIDELREINRIIKSSGLLCIGTPNVDGFYPKCQKFYRKIGGATWDYLNPPFHFYGFNKENLVKLVGKAGFRVIRIDTFSSLKMNDSNKRRQKDTVFRLVMKTALSKFADFLNIGDRMICYATKI